jgi:hypothetical protein
VAKINIENSAKVEAYERCLKSRKQEFLDHCHLVSQKYLLAGENKLACNAWPLRPLFIDQQRLQFISSTIFGQLKRCRDRLLALADSPKKLAEQLRFPEDLLLNLDLPAELNSPDFLSAVRPDGFLLPDRFVLSEYNLGSGLLATLSYTEVLFELLGRGPVMDNLPWSQSCQERPFQRYLELLRARGYQIDIPHIALFSPAQEQKDIYPWEMELFQTLFHTNGFSTEFTDETELFVNDQGLLASQTSSRSFDLLLQMTTGEYFLNHPDSLADQHRFLTGERVGPVAHVHPLSCLLLGKGALPARLAGGESVFNKQGDFLVQPDRSHFVEEKNAAEYRLNKDRYVIKRSWVGKDTVIGCSSGGRAWNRIVAEAIDSSRFIIQEYCPLPTLKLPFLIDGGDLEYIPVRFELSPFIIQGRYAGALVRYAPDMEGIRLSPSPPDLGMTIVFS